MNYENLYMKHITIAQSINEVRTDMRSNTKCVSIYLDNKRITSIGVNKSKTHPLLLKYNYHTFKYYSAETFNSTNNKRKRPQYPIHAELDGYIKLLNSGDDFNTLLIYRGDNCNMPSEPCHVCSNWLRKINKLTVCYIDINGEFKAENSEDLIGHHRRLFATYKTLQITDH